MKLRHTSDDRHIFYCLGCKCCHGFDKTWKFNGDLEKPDVFPSLLSTDGGVTVCHMFISKGRFIFLDDCTHELKGQSIEMPDIEDHI